MVVVTLKLDSQDVGNLKIFLNRVQLTGQEVAAYTKIIQAIYWAEKEVEATAATEKINPDKEKVVE